MRPLGLNFGLLTLSCRLSDKGWQTLEPAFAFTSQWWNDVKLRIKRYAIQNRVTRARRGREQFSQLCGEVKFLILLPKSGDPLDPYNKSPITLLNVNYRLLAKALCNRLAPARPHLVGDLQTCAVKSHCIQQNLWLMRDFTDFVLERDLPCAFVSLVQQKAFDMVDRGFLMNALETFQ
ncbi:hypothetical protein BSL78_07410 [Apostichopus japonicus]|uniref:Uncharacterized protein n=1 Tax=Stichopus japonicus TaxID=307972 RepID=A0A2G8L5Z4_STIJA|nr:hypothetical protein BSL78_07410 [Apostichopus japonicus]